MQYPMNMGLKGQSNALQVEVDAEGRIKYELVLRQGGAQEKVIHYQLTDLLPKQVLRDDDLKKPDDQTVEETIVSSTSLLSTEVTRAALQALTQSKIAAALPFRHCDKIGPASYIRYMSTRVADLPRPSALMTSTVFTTGRGAPASRWHRIFIDLRRVCNMTRTTSRPSRTRNGFWPTRGFRVLARTRSERDRYSLSDIESMLVLR